MRKIEIYDPAMCCSTGVCGPSVDPELLRVATTVDVLKKQGADIVRYNLASDPGAFVKNAAVSCLLEQDSILPITMVDGEIVKTGSHLTNAEFTTYSGIAADTDKPAKRASGGCCCGGSSCC